MLLKKFFIAFLMFFSISVCAKNIWIVEDIKFKGLINFSHDEILKNVVFNIGDKISQNDVKNSIKSLFKTGIFEDIQVVYSGKTVIFYLRERPVISNIVFSGNSIIDNSTLKEYLKKLNIEKGKSLNPFRVKIFIKTIKNFYDDIGRYKSNVKIIKFFSKKNTINLKIFINEGSSIKINKIKIFGNKDIFEKNIISLFKSKEEASWWNFLDKSIYSPKILRNDLVFLKNFYLNNGYFNFNILNKKIEFLKNENRVNINIDIFEGSQYKISHFFVNGNLFSYRESIEKIINIKNNELYNKEKINSIVIDIKRLLAEHGYIQADIIVDSKINYKTKKITLNFNIDLKKQFFVNKISFKGNRLTKDRVLRREIKQIEGKYFNIKLVELGKELLEKRKYFTNVEVFSNVDFYDSNKVNLVYKVKEKPTGSINFGLGYGIDSGVSFSTSSSQYNIFGSGNSLKSSIIKNKNQKYADISMSYPYFISNGIDLNARFFYNDFKYNLNNISSLIKNTLGFETNLGFPINNKNKVNFGFGYTHSSIIDTEKKIDSIFLMKKSELLFLKNDALNDFTLNYSWTFNSLKNIYFPISGNQTYLSGKNTIPGSDNNFYKIILDTEEYIPLNNKKNFIFLSHFHIGVGNSLNKKRLPFYENFHASSINNIRGFHLNTIGPKKIYHHSNIKNCAGYKNNNNICESIDSIGGNVTAVANLELITPIPLIQNKYSNVLRPSLFLDFGNIWDTQNSNIEQVNSLNFFKMNGFNDIYMSSGVSLKWFSPIGPLVFSYAIPIQNNKNHQIEAFQFHFGKNW